MPWKDTGTWAAQDEYGRLHLRGCPCANFDVEYDPRRGCPSLDVNGGMTESDAWALAARIEGATGYACSAVPFLYR